MSRTDKDLPYKVWKKRFPEKVNLPYPPPIGGAWCGKHWFSNFRNRQDRRNSKTAILNGEETGYYMAQPDVSWDIW